MEGFAAVGIIVVALVFYAMASVIVAGIVTSTDSNNEKTFLDHSVGDTRHYICCGCLFMDYWN